VPVARTAAELAMSGKYKMFMKLSML